MLNWLEMKEIMVSNQGGVMKELSALVYQIINVPGAAAVTRRPARLPEVTPAGVASLLLGASLALMLCGSVTFVIGFILMPWVLGLLAVFHLLGLLSHLSLLGKSFFAAAASVPPPRPSPISGTYMYACM